MQYNYVLLITSTIRGTSREKFYQEQKQPPEMFYKRRCSHKYCKIHSKTPVPESLVFSCFLVCPSEWVLLQERDLDSF